MADVWPANTRRPPADRERQTRARNARVRLGATFLFLVCFPCGDDANGGGRRRYKPAEKDSSQHAPDPPTQACPPSLLDLLHPLFSCLCLLFTFSFPFSPALSWYLSWSKPVASPRGCESFPLAYVPINIVPSHTIFILLLTPVFFILLSRILQQVSLRNPSKKNPHPRKHLLQSRPPNLDGNRHVPNPNPKTILKPGGPR